MLDGLYLGNEQAASNHDWITAEAITHILNCSKEVPCFFEEEAISSESELKLVYHRISVEDSEQENLTPLFSEACEFIRSSLASGGKVQIYCLFLFIF